MAGLGSGPYSPMESAQIAEFCDPEKVRKLIAYHVGGGYGAANHLYRLLSTELWLEECVAQ